MNRIPGSRQVHGPLLTDYYQPADQGNMIQWNSEPYPPPLYLNQPWRRGGGIWLGLGAARGAEAGPGLAQSLAWPGLAWLGSACQNASFS